ncbi:MAG TPA: sigma-E factor negative regulatory protein [Burkholderiales bacterium]|nr:sigma-E factor negative regulatory protein [Burkholderiales bacterium]
MERISALIDGELEDDELAREFNRLEEDPEWRSAWDAYHLIGDVLRGQGQLTEHVVERVSVRLTSEPTVLAPKPRRASLLARRAVLPIAASVVGMAVVAWLAVFNDPLSTQPALVADAERSVESVAVVVEPAGSTMNEYLMAHQQFSPSTAMQGVGSYVRTVSVREADYRP